MSNNDPNRYIRFIPCLPAPITPSAAGVNLCQITIPIIILKFYLVFRLHLFPLQLGVKLCQITIWIVKSIFYLVCWFHQLGQRWQLKLCKSQYSDWDPYIQFLIPCFVIVLEDDIVRFEISVYRQILS